MNRFMLDDKTAIVTGAGRGIGKEIALQFAKAGANVVIAEIDRETCEDVRREIEGLGRRSLSIITDVTDRKQIAKLVEATINEFGRIDILVNNVGTVNKFCPVVLLDDNEWDRVIKVCLTSNFLTSKTIASEMIKQGKGNIINIASAAGTRPVPGLSAYAAAKAGVINFTKTLSIELARYHIRVNCINPGQIEAGQGALRGAAQERVERAGIPLGRVGQPEDVAFAAIYLASDASDYITGACIEVKGGPYARKGDTEMFITRFPEI